MCMLAVRWESLDIAVCHSGSEVRLSQQVLFGQAANPRHAFGARSASLAWVELEIKSLSISDITDMCKSNTVITGQINN